VIYYLRINEEIWLLDIYAKGDRAELNDFERKTIARIISDLKKL